MSCYHARQTASDNAGPVPCATPECRDGTKKVSTLTINRLPVPFWKVPPKDRRTWFEVERKYISIGSGGSWLWYEKESGSALALYAPHFSPTPTGRTDADEVPQEEVGAEDRKGEGQEASAEEGRREKEVEQPYSNPLLEEAERLREERPRIQHELKSHPGPFNDVLHNRKLYEIRHYDRKFRVGDAVLLLEWMPDPDWRPFMVLLPEGSLSGREILARIIHLTPPGTWGLPQELCVFGIELIASTANREDPVFARYRRETYGGGGDQLLQNLRDMEEAWYRNPNPAPEKIIGLEARLAALESPPQERTFPLKCMRCGREARSGYNWHDIAVGFVTSKRCEFCRAGLNAAVERRLKAVPIVPPDAVFYTGVDTLPVTSDEFNYWLDWKTGRVTKEQQMHSAFQFHKLTPEGQAKAKGIAEAFDHLLSSLTAPSANNVELVPDGPYRSTMIRKLEEACFFAKKAMAEKNGEPAFEIHGVPMHPWKAAPATPPGTTHVGTKVTRSPPEQPDNGQEDAPRFDKP